MISLFKKIPKEIFYVAAIAGLALLWNCERQNKAKWKDRYSTIETSYQNTQEALADTLRYWQSKDGRRVAEIRSLESDNVTMESILKTEMPELKGLLEEQNIRIKQLSNVVSTQGELITSFNPNVTLIDTFIGNDSVEIITLDYKEAEWIDFHAEIPMVDCNPRVDATKVDFSASVPLDIVEYWDRKRWFGLSWTPKWFGKKYYQTQVSSKNPYISISKVKHVKKRK